MSLARLQEHRRLWQSKPELQRVYRPWFEALVAHAPRGARVLEVGAGPGFLAAFARERRADLRWVASDIHAASWNDLAADATRLPLRDATLAAVVGLDILHHLARPAHFFREAARTLAAQGELLMIEPWVTPLSWPIFRLLHQEDCRLGIDPWQPFPADGKDSFSGDAAVPWRLARDTSAGRWRDLGLEPPTVEPLNAFAYVLSGGFRDGSLLPAGLVRPVMALDRLARRTAAWTGVRALLSWRKATERTTTD